MSEADFESLLDASATEVTEPKLYPTGTWLLRCVGTFIKKNDDGHDEVSLAYIGVEPAQDAEGSLLDVNADELEAAGDDYDGNRIWKRFTIETKRDLFDLKRHISNHGVDVESGATLRDLVSECRRAEVYGYVGTRTYQTRTGETKTDNTVKQFAPVEGFIERQQRDAA